MREAAGGAVADTHDSEVAGMTPGVVRADAGSVSGIGWSVRLGLVFVMLLGLE